MSHRVTSGAYRDTGAGSFGLINVAHVKGGEEIDLRVHQDVLQSKP